MFLIKENNQIIVQEYSGLNTRNIKQILLITKGIFVTESIRFEFNEKRLNSLFQYLSQNNIDYNTDQNLTNYLEESHKEEEQFEHHIKLALDIKNNLEDASKSYVKFLNEIKPLMKRNMYSHQAKAAFHMSKALNSCNFSVPGTGKTTIVYAAFTYLMKQNKIDKLLIVGPLSSFLAWKNEYFECFGEVANITNMSVLSKEEKIKYLKSYKGIQSKITFINYEGFRGVGSALSDFLEKNRVMMVLDEAHKIKNPNAQRSTSIMKYGINAVSKVILTGTPIPNGYKDLYNLFNFIWPNKNIIGFNINQLDLLSKEPNQKGQIIKLMNNIDPFYIRITKKTLNLPEPIFHEPIFVNMGSLQQKIYDFISEDFMNDELDFKDDELRMNLKKAKLIRLMQVVTNPGSIAKSLNKSQFNDSEHLQLINRYENIETPPKYKATYDLIKKIIKGEEKVIVWTQFTYNLKTLKKYLYSKNIKAEMLFGEIENQDREVIIEEFHNNKDLKVLIANPAAVAESISLHKVCHNAIYLDKNFNASQYMQSKDRIHRVGLNPKDKINYYFLLSKNSIESVIHKRLLEKESNMLDVIEGREVPLFSNSFGEDLSNEDIKAIEDYFTVNSTR